MAIARMKKLQVIGMQSDMNRLLDLFQSLKCVEIIKTEQIDDTSPIINNELRKEDSEKFSRISFALEVLRENNSVLEILTKENEEYKKLLPKKPLPFSPRRDIDFSSFNDVRKLEERLNENALKPIEEYAKKQNEIKQEITRLNNLIEALRIYCELDVPFSEIQDTKNTTQLVGILSGLPADFEHKFNEEFKLSHFEKVGQLGTNTAFFICCHNEERNEVLKRLGDYSLSKVSYAFELLTKEESERSKRRIAELKNNNLELIQQIGKINKYKDELELLYDHYNFEINKIDREEEFMCTSKTFVLEGWVPEIEKDRVEGELKHNFDAILVSFTDPKKGDNPPTLTINNKIVAPYEGVTNMYSAPSPFETDPNKFVSVFFFLFFGLMLGDAGYGLVLAIAATLIIKFLKPEGGTRNLVLVIGMGGVSALLWGILLGGWFGIDEEIIRSTPIIGKLMLFSPLGNPIYMLAISLGLGLIQIISGMSIQMVAYFRAGDIKSALCDDISWFLIFVGIGLLALGLNIAGYVVAGLGVLIILVLGGRDKKGIGKVTGGLGKLYGVSSYISDILSYARLFGLGLASGVIAMVFNTIAGLLLAKWYLFPLGLVILLFGHVFNIAIGVLGAYVHDCRLQYIEFFSRFYTGGGHQFKPFGEDTKFVRIR